jgi:endonuclease-3 related protein
MPRLTLKRASPVRRRLLRLYEALSRRYGPQGWWPARSAFEVVVGAMLTKHAAWPTAEPVVARLRAAGILTPSAVARLAPERLAALLRPSGPFRLEARRLRAFVDHLAARYGGHLGRMLRQPVDRLRAELLDVPGIGPQTADAILLYAAGRPVFVVDADTRRVLARHGIVPPAADYAALRTLFMTNLPHDPALFNEYHALVVRVAKAHCRTRPDCAGCPLRPDLGGRPPRG